MQLVEINKSEYELLFYLKTKLPFRDFLVFPSPNKLFELHLFYEGEYRFGDPYFYAELIKLDSNEVFWSYKSGNPIRCPHEYPWSSDSQTCYFSLIENGNKIVKIEIAKLQLFEIFSPKQSGLTWIIEVLKNQNGVLFNYEYLESGISKKDYFIYLNQESNLIKINDFIEVYNSAPIEISKSDVIFIANHKELILFNYITKQTVERVQSSIGEHNLIYCHFIESTNLVILDVRYKLSEPKYFKIDLQPLSQVL
jgi:hypothetical protein